MKAAWLGLGIALGLSVAATAEAEPPYRRPGLGGVWVKRHLTAPMNSLSLLFGPGQPMLFAQRFDQRIVDAGTQYSRLRLPSDGAAVGDVEKQLWTRLGVAFGLTEDWEAGALFVPLRWTPSFAYSNILVYVTRGFRFDAVDFGIRLSFQTPTKRKWSFNPSIPILIRLGGVARIDTGIFVPFSNAESWWAGINVPLRVTVNATPHLFFGAQTGFVDPRFDRDGDAAVPLGALAGYTLVAGASVVDVTATFTWDNFWLVDSAPRIDSVQSDAYRVVFGLTIHRLIR